MKAIAGYLNQLEASGLLRLGTTQPEPQYHFRHAFIHDVAYASLVKQDRQRLHLKVGQTLERLYPDRLAEFSPRLAAHFDQAGDLQQALHYYILAGKTAAQTYANAEAVMHFECAIEIITTSPLEAQVPSEQAIELFSQKGRSLELMGHYTEAVENYIKMENYGARTGQAQVELEALMARATIHSTPTTQYAAELGFSLIDRALELAHQLNDQAAEARIYWNLLLANFFAGNNQQAAEYGQKSLALARELSLNEQLAHTLNDLGVFVYVSAGDFDRGREVLLEAIAIWRILDNQPMLADTLTNLSEIYYFNGNFEQSLLLASEAFEISKSVGNYWGQAYSMGLSFLPYLEMGEVDQALDCFEKALSLGEEAGFLAMRSIAKGEVAFFLGLLGETELSLQFAQDAVKYAEEDTFFWLVPALGSLALVQTLRGDLESAEATLERAYSIGITNGRSVFDFFAVLAKCELGLRRQEFDQVKDSVSNYLTSLRNRKARTHIPYALFYLGRALAGKGEVTEARDVLNQALMDAEAIQARFIQLKIQALLIELYLRQGSPEETHDLCEKGRENMEYLMSRISRPELSGALGAQPEMRALLACSSSA